jgi:hypothetical protein
MNFREPNSAAWKFDICRAFQFSPTTFAVNSIQPRQITNAFIDRDIFNIRDFAVECKINHFKLKAIFSAVMFICPINIILNRHFSHNINHLQGIITLIRFIKPFFRSIFSPF